MTTLALYVNKIAYWDLNMQSHKGQNIAIYTVLEQIGVYHVGISLPLTLADFLIANTWNWWLKIEKLNNWKKLK